MSLSSPRLAAACVLLILRIYSTAALADELLSLLQLDHALSSFNNKNTAFSVEEKAKLIKYYQEEALFYTKKTALWQAIVKKEFTESTLQLAQETYQAMMTRNGYKTAPKAELRQNRLWQILKQPNGSKKVDPELFAAHKQYKESYLGWITQDSQAINLRLILCQTFHEMEVSTEEERNKLIIIFQLLIHIEIIYMDAGTPEENVTAYDELIRAFSTYGQTHHFKHTCKKFLILQKRFPTYRISSSKVIRDILTGIITLLPNEKDPKNFTDESKQSMSAAMDAQADLQEYRKELVLASERLEMLDQKWSNFFAHFKGAITTLRTRSSTNPFLLAKLPVVSDDGQSIRFTFSELKPSRTYTITDTLLPVTSSMFAAKNPKLGSPTRS